MESITAANLRSAVYFLASDEMRGRDTNTPHNEIATRYLAHRFEMMGVRPGGDDSSYFQHFTLLQARLSSPNRMEIRRQGTPLATVALLHEDFFPTLLSASGKVTAPVAFAGFGITAPEHGYDDYRDVDVRGKIVMALIGEPRRRDPESPFEGLVPSDYGRELHKVLNAQNQGASGFILISAETGRSAAGDFLRLARGTWPEDPKRSRYFLQIWAEEIHIPAVQISPKVARTLLQDSGLDLNEIRRHIDRDLEPRTTLLDGVEVVLETAVTHQEIGVRNVLGFQPGSDSRLRDEVVVVGAHFDHVGYEGDEIYNGADDNASGTAGLLEVAAAFAASPQAPRRSLLFAAWNAEEQGLLGSYYYVARPRFPLEKTTAMFQMDMIGRDEEVSNPENPRFRGFERQSAEENRNAVNVLGYSRSSDLQELVGEVNRAVGLDLHFRYDNHVQALLRRSDNWPFLVSGVPALFFNTGLHPDYHRPTDTPDKINYEKMEKVVRLVFLTSWEAANRPERPVLHPHHVN